MKNLWLQGVVAAASLSPTPFSWDVVGDGCSAEYCDPKYSSSDAPQKTDECLKKSSSNCTISYGTSLNFDSDEMCVYQRYLWMNLTAADGWILHDGSHTNLYALATDVTQCGGYSIVATQSLSKYRWCSANVPADFHMFHFQGVTEFSVPRWLSLNKVKYLIIRSPPSAECWLWITSLTQLTVNASYRKSNIGTYRPVDTKSILTDKFRSIAVVGGLLISSMLFLVILKKVCQAALVSAQELAVTYFALKDD